MSQGLPPSSGKVKVLEDLSSVQGSSYSTPTVLLAQGLGGTEDIPLGCSVLLTRNGVDVLSHVAIRARCQGVLLAVCDDAEEWARLEGLEVRVQVVGQGLGGLDVGV